MRTETTRRAAISRLLEPPAASSAISRSRAGEAGGLRRAGERRRPGALAVREPEPGARRGGARARPAAGVAVPRGRGLRRLDRDEQRIVLREALGRREQRGAVAGDERRGVGGGEPGVRAVDPLGELREAGRGGRRVAEPAERVQRPDGVGVLPARPRGVGRVPGERPRARELAGRRRAPGARQPELDREALVPERGPVQLRDRGARRAGVARLRRGLGDAGEREREHADGVAVAQQRGALAAEAQRRRDAAAREPGEAEHVRLDGDRGRRPPAAQLLVGVRGLRRGLGQPAGQAQGQRAHPEQHRLGVGQVVVAAPRDRQPFPGQRDRLGRRARTRAAPPPRRARR